MKYRHETNIWEPCICCCPMQDLFFFFPSAWSNAEYPLQKRDLERIHWHFDCTVLTASFSEHNLFIVKVEWVKCMYYHLLHSVRTHLTIYGLSLMLLYQLPNLVYIDGYRRTGWMANKGFLVIWDHHLKKVCLDVNPNSWACYLIKESELHGWVYWKWQTLHWQMSALKVYNS